MRSKRKSDQSGKKNQGRKVVVVVGPGPRFKGGIANYTSSLCRALDRQGDLEVHLVSWIAQYPVFIPRDFIDRKSRSNQLEDSRVKVHYLLNYNNPISWARTARFIRNLEPDRVVIQWAISIQGIPLGHVAARLRKSGIRVFFDLHNVMQKESSGLDRWMTSRCIRHGTDYVVHSADTFRELESLHPGIRYELLFPGKDPAAEGLPVLKLFHPVYDMFRKDPDFDTQAFKASLGLRKHVFLFFGFIRKYKGLHQAIEAFNIVAKQRDDVSLLVVGELFWNTLDDKKPSTRFKQLVFGLAKGLLVRKKEDERNYRPLDLIGKYGLQDRVAAVTEFVPNEAVHQYFQASDYLVLYYQVATVSGVESLAYNFGLPILATRIGPFPETIRDGFNGYLAEPGDIGSMAEAMLRGIEAPIPSDHVYSTASSMSWESYASAIMAR